MKYMYVYDILHHYMQQTLKQEVAIYKILQIYLGAVHKKKVGALHVRF